MSNQDILHAPDGKPVRELCMNIPDFLGILRSSIVIKSLVSVNHVYEIRINSEFRKERIIFYSTSSRSGVVLTFYFDKQDGNDLTNELASETEDIHQGKHSLILC